MSLFVEETKLNFLLPYYEVNMILTNGKSVNYFYVTLDKYIYLYDKRLLMDTIQTDLRKYNVIGGSINLSSNHWMLYVCFVNKREITVIDPLTSVLAAQDEGRFLDAWR